MVKSTQTVPDLLEAHARSYERFDTIQHDYKRMNECNCINVLNVFLFIHEIYLFIILISESKNRAPPSN